MIAAILCMAATQSLANVSSIVMPEGGRVMDASTIDVDGDGSSDMLIASVNGTTRTISIHLRRATGAAFTSTADASLDLQQDVVCFAAGDVHADLGREIVLFNANGAFVWRWRESEESRRVAKLAACELLWQWPDRLTAFAWQSAITDVDGDGLDDLTVPEPNRLRVLFQRRGEDGKCSFDVQQVLVPGDSDSGGRALDFDRAAEVRQAGTKRRTRMAVTSGGVQIDGDRDGVGPYLWIQENVPAPQIVDFDGDGDRDVLFLENDALVVFTQSSAGVFANEPLRLKSPVPVTRARELDVSYLAKSLDLDGDQRVDCVFSAGDKRSKDVRTQVLVFLSKFVKTGEAALFGNEGTPSQLLLLDGFARPIGFEDVDGDGKPDFVAGAVKPDLIDGLRAAASERIDAELYVYKNTGVGFSKRPDLVHKISIQAGGLDLVARFLGDVTGDGVADFFERADKSLLKVHMVRRTRDGLTVVEKPIFEWPLEADARLLLPRRLGAGSWDVFAIEKEAVRCASFR
ncbi:MAG: VCBS repeat-containing protein [Planctomycetota bacterium]|nr:VCBS repeat-containing protein [Planctomycetota bacterium]